jgi:uncharacterized membrane protein
MPLAHIAIALTARPCFVERGDPLPGGLPVLAASKPRSLIAMAGSSYDSQMNVRGESARQVRIVPAGARVAVAAGLGVISGVVVSQWLSWQPSILIGWDVGAWSLGTWIWLSVGRLSADETKTHANREDPSVRLSEVVVLGSGVALLAAVGLVLIRAGHASGGTKAFLIALGVVSVALSWALVHTVFTLRYARAYCSTPDGGIDFNEGDPPTYLDFAYLALTIGMTFQVSDTNLTSKRIRRIALLHALLSYLFGAVIVALVINVVSSLLH